MTLVIALLAASVLLELLLHLLPGVWQIRKVVAAVTVVCNGFASAAIVVWRFDVWSLLLLGLGLYRILNNLRVVEGRMHEEYLRRATRRTALVLIGYQGVIAGLWVLWARQQLELPGVWLAIACVQAGAALVLLAATVRRLHRTVWPSDLERIDDRDLPAITVAIPARNETEDLQNCLESVIASDYPKLEIIVLDDRSQTRRTPEIIRSFAHDGVRFILGEPPKDTWLPKNQAYARLAAEASGEVIVFCGADVRFAPDTLRQMITFMYSRDKQMVSILPEHHPIAMARFALIQAARYWWELAPPRRLLHRPPVLSSCWAITAHALKKAGGLQAVARSIVPEAYFAKRLALSDGYSFMRAGTTLGLESTKLAADQRATAIRTRYPQLHRRPENVFVTALVEFGLLLLPFGLSVAGFWMHAMHPGAHLLILIASFMLVATYELIAVSTRVNTWSFGLVALPFVVLIDLGLLHYSMWRYEFATVEWKGRNVSVPAMHVIPHLPEVD